MREELEKLGRLQELDLKIDRARMLVSSAPAIYREIESEITKEKSGLNLVAIHKADLEKQKRGLETEIVMDQDRIKNIESRLNTVTNNKEFHAVTKEAEKAKKLISDREKTIVELTEKISAQDKIAGEFEARIASLNEKLEVRKNEVGSQVGEADKEIASYAGDRNSIISEITPPLMSRYNRIRVRYNDALVACKGGHCTSCNVALPPQMYIQVQKCLEFLACPSCQRLLFFKV